MKQAKMVEVEIVKQTERGALVKKAEDQSWNPGLAWVSKAKLIEQDGQLCVKESRNLLFVPDWLDYETVRETEKAVLIVRESPSPLGDSWLKDEIWIPKKYARNVDGTTYIARWFVERKIAELEAQRGY